MSETHVPRTDPRPREAGMALVLAIMALMLLTFLGLTLAATTSTELQIATNYRWSEQARYNAEAGIEAGKVILRNIPDFTPWNRLLPTVRAGSWNSGGTTAVSHVGTEPAGALVADDWGKPLRNWENSGCDSRGGNVGYGVILNDVGMVPAPQGPMQNKTVIFGQRLNGAVTLWVRHAFDVSPIAGDNISDNSSPTALVLTAEGVAPFADGNSGLAFAAANQATYVYQASLLRQIGDPCEAYRAQAGNGVSGSGFAVCSALKQDCSGGDKGGEENLLEGGLGDEARAQGGALGQGSGTSGTFGSKQDALNPGSCVQ